jgi:hypothetical protein
MKPAIPHAHFPVPTYPRRSPFVTNLSRIGHPLATSRLAFELIAARKSACGGTGLLAPANLMGIC